MASDDDALFPNPGIQHPGSVIDLADVRVERGIPRNRHSRCKHKRLLYESSDRRVWCRDCEREVEAFDAFMTLVDNFGAMTREVKRQQHEAEEAAKAHVHRKAARNLSLAWSGKTPMAVACPHCSRGLLPEDFEGGGSQVSKDIEMARRAREGDGNG